jgi:hypothetical protein
MRLATARTVPSADRFVEAEATLSVLENRRCYLTAASAAYAKAVYGSRGDGAF